MIGVKKRGKQKRKKKRRAGKREEEEAKKEKITNFFCFCFFDRDRKSGGVAGRIEPSGDGQGILGHTIVWEQQFSYVISHFFMKAAEEYAGSTLCLPGCFSLMRLKAVLGPPGTDFIRDDMPVYKYSKQLETPADVLLLSQGEDRTLCTWLTQCGWKLSYCPMATARTSCPTSVNEYYQQQRRWNVATLENLDLLLHPQDKKSKVLGFFLQIIVRCQLYSTFLAPILITLLLLNALTFVSWQGVLLALGIPFFFEVLCAYCWIDPDSPPLIQNRCRMIQLIAMEGFAVVYMILWLVTLFTIGREVIFFFKFFFCVFLNFLFLPLSSFLISLFSFSSFLLHLFSFFSPSAPYRPLFFFLLPFSFFLSFLSSLFLFFIALSYSFFSASPLFSLLLSPSLLFSSPSLLSFSSPSSPLLFVFLSLLFSPSWLTLFSSSHTRRYEQLQPPTASTRK